MLTQAISGILTLFAASSVYADVDFTGGAQSAIDLDTASTARAFAQEIDATVVDSKTLLSYGANGANANDAGVLSAYLKAGAALSDTAPRYARFELSNGDTSINRPIFFNTPIGCSGTATTALACTLTPIAGGNGSHFVVFKFAPTTPLTKDDFVGMHFATAATDGVKIKSTAQDIKINYTLHTNEVSAVQNQTGASVAATKSNLPYINFKASLNFAVTPASGLVAEVEKDFLKFTPNNTIGSLGEITYNKVPNVHKADGDITGLTTLLQNTTKLEVIGDMTGLQDVNADGTAKGTYPTASTSTDPRIYLGTTSCAIGGTFETTASGDNSLGFSSLTADKAVFNISNFLTGGTNNLKLCMKPAIGVSGNENSQVVIPESDYTVKLVPVQGTGFVFSGSTQTLSSVTHNGTVLEAPYFTLTSGYISRFILSHLNPNGKDAKYTIKVQTDEGSTPVLGTTTGTLKKGTILQIPAGNIVTKFTKTDGSGDGKPRGSAVFTIVAPNNDVQGVYQTVNPSGEVTSIPMTRPGGADGN